MLNSGISRFALLVVAGLLCPVVLNGSPVAFAHDEEAEEREVEQHKRQIEELLERARKLQDEDKHDRARELITKAERMQNALRKHEEREGEHERGGLERSVKILRGLKHGIEALDALGGHGEAVEHLQEIAAHLEHRLKDEMAAAKEKGGKNKKKKKKKGKRQRTEREVAEHWLELMHLAHRVLNEADRGDCAEVMEHACHAFELKLKGRRDAEARKVYETAPKREVQSECLGIAAEILADKGEKKQAAWLAELAQRFRGKRAKREGGERERERPRERMREPSPRPKDPRKKLGYDLEVMSMAMPALLEANREELAHQIELAMEWRRMWLEGKRGSEMQAARRKAPTIGSTAEIVGHAAHLWREFGRPDKAAWLAAVRDGLLEDAGLRKPRKRERPRREHEEVGDLEELYEQLEQLQERLEGLREHIRRAAR